MRNLKRALSLVMAMALIVGMMVVSASAVSTKDFTDSDEIQHTEAVDTMVALNVIAGKEDGSYYDPTGTLTRAEMAKVVAYVMNGGVEPNIGTKVIPTYSDIDNHWAEAYIEYCTSMGIIAGDGAGKFNPEGTLTAEQCAKMFLTAIGYNANVFGFTGNDWAMNVGRYANEAGLYEDLGDVRVSQPISRDDAAQMAYNAIQATMMKRSWNQDMQTGQIVEVYEPDSGKTLFTEKFNGTIYEGVLNASGSMAPYAGTTGQTTWTAGRNRLNVTTQVIDGVEQAPADIKRISLNYATDVTDLIGEYVKVLYDNDDRTVYGVYSVEDETTVVVETNRAGVGVVKATDASVEIDGVTYDLSATADAVPAYATNGVITVATWSNGLHMDDVFANDNRNDDYVKLVDNNGDGKIDVAFVIGSELKDVNYVGSDSMTLSDIGSVKNADMNLADSAYAVDEKVFVTPKCATFNGNYDVAKAEVVEGKVESVRRATVNGVSNTVTAVQIDGNWYALVATSSGSDLAVSGSVIVDDMDHALALDSTYKLYVRGGYAYAADIVTAGAVSIGVITGVNTSNKDFDGNTWIRLLKSDGTTVEAYANWADVAISSTAYAPAGGLDAGQLVTYTVDDDVYVLYPAGAPLDDADDALKALGGYDAATGIGAASYTNTTSPEAYGATYAKDGNDVRTINGKRIADSAVVFVEYDSNVNTAGLQSAWTVLSGKEVNSWNVSAFGDNGGGLYNTTGLGFLDVAIISMSSNVSPIPGSTTQYAYVTSTVDYTGTTASYYIWDGTSSEPVRVTENKSATEASKGAVISFGWDGEGTIKDVKAIPAAANLGALTYTSGNQVSISGTGYDLADDVVILNVDTDAKAGVPGTAIAVAAKDASGLSYQNVLFQTDATNPTKITLLVVDVVNGRWIGGALYTPAQTLASGVNSTALKAMANGLYVPTDTSAAPDASHIAANLRYFKFETTAASQNVTLKIGTTVGGNDIYQETATSVATGDYFFTVDVSGYYNTSTNTVSGSLSGASGAPLASGTTYYYEVAGTADGTLLSGSFVMP